MIDDSHASARQRIGLVCALLATVAVYFVGLRGGFVFDDFPNIVENSVLRGFADGPGSFIAAIFSSGSSEIQRPLAMLSFIVNLATSGIDPLPMKVLNLAIHLLNGVLLYRLTKLLIVARTRRAGADAADDYRWLPLFVAAAWLLAPINFMPVLYVVQRMESLSHTFVFLALIVYCNYRLGGGARPFGRTLAVTVPALVFAGLLVKESAALTLLYAFLIEVLLLAPPGEGEAARERRVLQRYFMVVLWLPAVLGGVFLWLKFGNAEVYATRPFTLGERLLTQWRVVAGYIDWTLLPRLSELGLFHDDIAVSKGLLSPVSTLLSLLALLGLVAFAVLLRQRRPFVALGILLFFAAHVLTATFLPLDLAYEHRNYFASYGLLLALGSELVVRRGGQNVPVVRAALAFILLALFVPTTFKRALEWSHPLSLATAEAQRRPQSPRATYELGRTYIVLAHANPGSTNYTDAAFESLERAARVPNATILPEQALLILASRANVPVREEWWNALYEKLRAAPPDISDTTALFAIQACVRRGECRFDERHMLNLFGAALVHEPPPPDVLTIYAGYALNVLDDPALTLRLFDEAIALRPKNAQFRENRAELLIAMGRKDDAKKDIAAIAAVNRFGRETPRINRLRRGIESNLPPRYPQPEPLPQKP